MFKLVVLLLQFVWRSFTLKSVLGRARELERLKKDDLNILNKGALIPLLLTKTPATSALF